MKNKKIIIGVIVGVIILAIIIGVVLSSNGTKKSDNYKGTRNNPYTIGDTINISGMYHHLFDSYKNIEFGLSLTLNKVYRTNEGLKIEKAQYDTFSEIPVAKITFKITGNYQDRFPTDTVFKIVTVNEEMKSSSYPLYSMNLESLDNIYTNTEYTVYVDGQYDIKANIASKIKYLVIEYYDKSNNKQSIYISLNSNETENKDVYDDIDAVMGLVNKTISNYKGVTANKSKMNASFIQLPKLSTNKINTNQTITVYPEIFITNDVFDNGIYKLNGIIWRFEFMDVNSNQSERYSLSADNIIFKTNNKELKNTVTTLPDVGDYNKTYYLSKFSYRLTNEEINKLKELINTKSLSITVNTKDSKTNLSDVSHTIEIPVSFEYKLEEKDYTVLDNMIKIYEELSKSL